MNHATKSAPDSRAHTPQRAAPAARRFRHRSPVRRGGRGHATPTSATVVVKTATPALRGRAPLWAVGLAVLVVGIGAVVMSREAPALGGNVPGDNNTPVVSVRHATALELETPTTSAEVDLTRAPSSILVDEDALSPRFRAQMEALLAPLSLLLIAALFVFHFRKTVTKNG